MSESDLVRCPACRGSKKVAKLGGIIGDCNTCSGLGKIKASDKAKLVEAIEADNLQEITREVEKAAAVAVSELKEDDKKEIKKDVKANPKRAIYKRKKD